MQYNKYTWSPQELITPDKLNHMEEGIFNNNTNTFKSFSISSDKPLNLDAVAGVSNTSPNSVVLTNQARMYSAPIAIPTNSTTVSATLETINVRFDSSSKGFRINLQYLDSNLAYISGFVSPYTKDLGSVTHTISKTVPSGASYFTLLIALDNKKDVVTVKNPAVSFGAENVVKNNQLLPGLDNWYPSRDFNGKLDAYGVYIINTVGNYDYIVEDEGGLTGTLPAGAIDNSLSGSRLQVRGTSDSGVGGVTQIMMIHGKVYQRTFGYMWYPWVEAAGVYGSFDDAGVYHDSRGDVVHGGLVYDFNSYKFYALDKNGKPYTTVGYQNLPVGQNNTEYNVKLMDNGVINPDISDSTEAIGYVDSINNILPEYPNASLNIVVTDSHGTNYISAKKDYDNLITGYNYNGMVIDRSVMTFSSSRYVSRLDESTTHDWGTYIMSITRLNANDSALNIKRIYDKFSKIPDVKSHLGDVDDGRNYTADEERDSYNFGSSNFKLMDFNMVDGNHDLNQYAHEFGIIKKGSTNLGTITPSPQLGRRKKEDRWLESYGKNTGYYTIYDRVHKVVYFYIDSFEDGLVKYKNQVTPANGVKISPDSKMSIQQLNWLISNLNNVPDDYACVINTHVVPPENSVGKQPTGSIYNNVNLDLFGGILTAFQNSTTYKATAKFTQDENTFDFSAYKGTVSANFSNKQKNRIAVINYGHFHTYGHVDKKTNGTFNIVQFPNMLSKYYDRVGNPQGSQFAVELVDVSQRKVYIKRFAPTEQTDPEFVLDF